MQNRAVLVPLRHGPADGGGNVAADADVQGQAGPGQAGAELAVTIVNGFCPDRTRLMRAMREALALIAARASATRP